MPYGAEVGDSAFSVVVATAREALAKVDELLDLENIDDVSVRDWAGKIVDLGALEAEAAEALGLASGGRRGSHGQTRQTDPAPAA